MGGRAALPPSRDTSCRGPQSPPHAEDSWQHSPPREKETSAARHVLVPQRPNLENIRDSSSANPQRAEGQRNWSLGRRCLGTRKQGQVLQPPPPRAMKSARYLIVISSTFRQPGLFQLRANLGRRLQVFPTWGMPHLLHNHTAAIPELGRTGKLYHTLMWHVRVLWFSFCSYLMRGRERRGLREGWDHDRWRELAWLTLHSL